MSLNIKSTFSEEKSSLPESKQTLKRRTFISLSGKILLLANLMNPVKQALSEESKKATIAVGKSEDKESLKKALAILGGMGKFVNTGSIVVLKPNISFPNPPEWGTTTSPWLVKTVAEICLESGAKKVVVVDNPLGSAPMKNVECSKIGEALSDLKEVEIMMLSEPRKYLLVEKNLTNLKSVQVARVLEKVDLLINLPTAKAHNETGVSLGLKNLMGLIWDRTAFHQGLNLEQAIAELACYIKPGLTIMDATRALLNNGPQGPGRVEEIGKIVVGIDPVAVDSYTLSLTHFNYRQMTPEQVPHIKYAEQIGLGKAKLEDMKIVEV
jgi:uncharacterized protein (DUF362 family)